MKKSRGIVSLILTVVVIAVLGYAGWQGFGPTHTGSARNIKLGLDLAGGVSITYQTVEENPSSEDMADTVYKLQQRVSQYSTEASVYQEGNNRIAIEIPGVNDANVILEELGQPGTLEFQDPSGNVVLEGTDIADAQAGAQQTSTTGATEYVVQLTMTDDGAEKFAQATEENVGQQISIIYDGEVISSPVVQQAIEDGQAVINGMSSYEEAESLASYIRIGGLSLELQELRSNVVGAQLGGEAIRTSLLAGTIGLAIVCVFMCFVYLLPGLASSLALLIYTGLVILLLNAFDITLTLPGIAGIILSIGMAVDANVIIFARVKEEISAGISVRSALKNGFHKALSAIVDGNVTTLIAAVVLGIMGTGSVRGFAQTLALGVIVSMFTALVITRIIIFSFYAVGIRDKKFYAKVKKAREPIPFLKHKKVFFTISIAAILIGFVAMGIQSARGNGALNYSMEFMGGTSTTVEFNEDYTIEELESQVVPVVEEATGETGVQTQKVQDSNQVIIKTQTLDLTQREALNTALEENFGVAEENITSENISSTVSSEMRRDAIVSVLVASVFMLLYIWFRFKDIRFAASAILALLNDVLFVLTFYAVARVSVGNTFIACMLTIVGYSINATIVIFDRIREELRVQKKNESLEVLVNRSITETLTRSIYTNLTTFIMVAVLFILGVSSIREFAGPLMVGVAGGTYSSICVTGALWYVLRTRFGKKDAPAVKGKKKK
ncbi:MAG TPA: protein translocase subunit SecD [Candidatus Bariatricus faecipullorum]|nr:protein translocase subunit SecD [Candidatus Bariatricus faecipullorum]